MKVSERIMFQTSFRAEATYRHQPIRFPKFSKENTPDLRHILPLIMRGGDFSQANVSSANVISVTERLKIDYKVLKDADEVLSYNVFDAVMYQDSKGDFYPRTGENVTITINFSGQKSLIIFVRGTASGLDTTSYIRLSWSLQNLQDTDDLRTDRSRNAPTVLSTLIAYDFDDTADFMAKYEACEKDVVKNIRKGQEITDEIQAYLLIGMRGRRTMQHYLDYANWLLSESRYTDALVYFKRAYEYMKPDIDKRPRKWKKVLVETCYNIALCYSHLDDHDYTMFYASLVDILEEYPPKAAELLSTLHVPEQKQLPEKLTLGYVLHVLFRIKEEQVKGLIFISDNQARMIFPEDSNVWDLEVEKLFSPNTTIVLPYSMACYHTHSETDKSKLFYCNSIIIRCDAVSGGDEAKMQRISIMIPTFILDDEIQNSSEELIRPRHISFVYNAEPHINKDANSADDLLQNANLLENDWCIMQALLEYERCSRVIGNADEHSCLVAYKTGFCLNELLQFEQAIEYLFVATKSMNMNAIIELVNALCNSHDIRAMAIIDYFSYVSIGNDNDPDVVQFRKFLSRRKVWTLIEQGKYKEARRELTLIKDDPELSEFAQNELDYINSRQQV